MIYWIGIWVINYNSLLIWVGLELLKPINFNARASIEKIKSSSQAIDLYTAKSYRLDIGKRV